MLTSAVLDARERVKNVTAKVGRAALNNLIVGAEIVEVREIHLDDREDDEND